MDRPRVSWISRRYADSASLVARGLWRVVDHAGLGRFDAGDKYGGVSIEYVGERAFLDLYYIGGGGLRQTLDAAAELLGRAPMPPRWALGYMQSSRHFDDTDELRRLPAMWPKATPMRCP